MCNLWEKPFCDEKMLKESAGFSGEDFCPGQPAEVPNACVESASLVATLDLMESATKSLVQYDVDVVKRLMLWEMKKSEKKSCGLDFFARGKMFL